MFATAPIPIKRSLWADALIPVLAGSYVETEDHETLALRAGEPLHLTVFLQHVQERHSLSAEQESVLDDLPLDL